MEPFVALERALERWSGVDHVAVCNTGTAALHLALECLGLPPGGEVLVPDFTFVACARAVTLAGLVPVFVDCKADDLTMDPAAAWEAVSPYTVAVMLVHAYGRSCDMPALVDLAKKHGLLVVEDLAEAHGLPVHPQSDAACWSFYRNKVVCAEEGGAVAFPRGDHAEAARSMRSLGYAGGGGWVHAPRGMNYRMTNTQATMVLASLEGERRNVARRRKSEGWYEAALPPRVRQGSRSVPWVYDVRVKEMTADVQDLLVGSLKRAGVAARHGFKPIHSQLEYVDCRRAGGHEAERASREVVCLPLPASPGEVAVAWDVIEEVLELKGLL